MRKDYVAADRREAEADEIEFIERFWTERWRESGVERAGDVAQCITRQDEYSIIQPYLARLPQGARILDGGCGTGEWTVHLARRGFDVIGLDISAATIDALRARFPDLRFERGDIRRLPFADNEIDAYLSWGTFEHFEDGLQPCIREAARVLRPGGHLFVTVPFHNLRHRLRELRPWPSWDAPLARALARSGASVRFYQWRLTAAELARELAIGGFEVIGTHPIHALHGLERTIEHDLRLRPGTPAHRAASLLLRIVLPRRMVAHMVMAVARRPGAAQ